MIDEGDEVTKFLNTIPPDWDAAMAHGEANMVLRATTAVDFDNKSSYC